MQNLWKQVLKMNTLLSLECESVGMGIVLKMLSFLNNVVDFV